MATTPLVRLTILGLLSTTLALIVTAAIPPPTTLAFVFDTTGSMSDDLNQVRVGVAKIIETVLKRKGGLNYNFVLVPFNDPGVGPLWSTTSSSEFQRYLNGLTISGGDDCPELSMGGIKMALEASGPKSFIYVFTDATAKDYLQAQQVLNLIKLKQSQVVFVLTGDCGEPTNPRYKIYETVASESSGQVFNLHKSDVNEIMNFIGSSMDAHTRNLNLVTTGKVDPGKHTYPVLVNNSMEELVVSVSGKNPTIEIRDPHKNLANTTDLLKIDSALVTSVKNPIPGNYTVTAGSSDPHTVKVAGSNFSNVIEFDYGFSTVHVTDIGVTNPRPLKGSPTFTIIRITKNTGGAQFTSVDIFGASTKTWVTIPLRKIQENVYEATTTFVPPDESFYLNIRGPPDGTGAPVSRLSATSISARLPELPTLTVTPKTVVTLGEAAKLICRVETTKLFTVQWLKRDKGSDTPIGPPGYYPNTRDVSLNFDSVKLSDEGSYVCNVKNSDGTVEKATDLDVKDLPPVIEDMADQTLIPGTDLFATCKAKSNSDVTLSWSRFNPIDSSYSSEYLKLEPRATDSGKGTLVIRDVRQSDAGTYRCEARNEGGISHKDTKFKNPDLPKVILEPVAMVKLGESTTLSCYVETLRPFTVQWMRKVKGSDIPAGPAMKYPNTRAVPLTLNSAKHSDEGTYICSVKTDEGSVQKTTVLDVKDLPPIIDDLADQGLVPGSDLYVTCTAKSESKFNLAWTRFNPIDSSYSSEYLKKEARVTDFGNGTLKVSNVRASDAGTYRCEARNEGGLSHKDIHFDKPVPPKARIPKRIAKFKSGESLSIACEVTGFPEPTVEWFYEDEKMKEDKNTIIRNDKLTITPMEMEDEGTYRCVATNAAGVAEADVSARFIEAPTIRASVAQVFVGQGSTATLQCVAEGAPTPKIYWFDNKNEDVSKNYYMKASHGTLTIFKIQKGDEGKYTCYANNEVGTAQATVAVNVSAPRGK